MGGGGRGGDGADEEQGELPNGGGHVNPPPPCPHAAVVVVVDPLLGAGIEGGKVHGAGGGLVHCHGGHQPRGAKHKLVLHLVRGAPRVQGELEEHGAQHGHSRAGCLCIDLGHVLPQLLPQPHHRHYAVVVPGLLGQIVHLVVVVGGATLVGRGAPTPVAMQAKQGAKGTELEPPNNQVLKNWVIRVSPKVTPDIFLGVGKGANKKSGMKEERGKE